MTDLRHRIYRVAAVVAVATFFCACKGKLAEADSLDMDEVPFQRIEKMFLVQTTNGVLELRAEADLMESYDKSSEQVDIFPEGFQVFAYTSDGDLETVIVSDGARHTRKKRAQDEQWLIYGNVIVQNVVSHETMETDTLYWDKDKGEFYTDCYVKMYSSDGLMQGYGFRSDERARNSIILRPFNSFGVVTQDSTAVVIDSVNFIGPMLKK